VKSELSREAQESWWKGVTLDGHISSANPKVQGDTFHPWEVHQATQFDSVLLKKTDGVVNLAGEIVEIRITYPDMES
jgi:hypothetical protein